MGRKSEVVSDVKHQGNTEVIHVNIASLGLFVVKKQKPDVNTDRSLTFSDLTTEWIYSFI